MVQRHSSRIAAPSVVFGDGNAMRCWWPLFGNYTMIYILVVDDHVDIRRLLSISLGSKYEVIEADNGTAALYAIHKYHPAAVLLDVMMPGEIDGLQVLDAVKSDPTTRDISIAMVTARGQKADSEDARHRGADAYFIKPFSPQQVVAWIQGHVH